MMMNINTHARTYFVLVMLLSVARLGVARIVPSIETTKFNVINYGAAGDGRRDDTRAFLQAWKATCSANVAFPNMVIPQYRTFLVRQSEFKGPCKATNVGVSIEGTIIAPDSLSEWENLDQTFWLAFRDINGLVLDGYGTINGRGQNWWKQSCKRNPNSDCTKKAPTGLKLVDCRDVKLRNLKFRDNPQIHLGIIDTEGLEGSNLNILAPATSPNTDGIHISGSRHIHIDHSAIGSGDDCFSLGNNISDIRITRIACGPGHGISVGSLGKDGEEVVVEEVYVLHSHFYGTTNGARIKTWQGGSGYARSIHFEHLKFFDVENPIIIDQYYCDSTEDCPNQSKAVKVSDVTYADLVGTSTTRVAVALNCSQSVSCDRLHFRDVNLTLANANVEAGVVCINAHGDSNGHVNPSVRCLQK